MWSLAKINDIKQYLYDAIKTLVTKDDIVKLKDLIEQKNSLSKDLTSKLLALEQKVDSSEASVSKLNTKVDSLEEKLRYLESQYELKARKLDDLEQYGRPECFKGLKDLKVLK